MTKFESVTPNLIVQNLDRSTAFYRDVLGFSVKQTVPDAPPFAFVWMERDGLNVFLNDAAAVAAELPATADRPFGGTATLYFTVTGVHALHDSVASRVPIIMPLKIQDYGMREFAVLDPDGHVLTFAERE
jgi:catechol 2,3-dioxygenase-like lactoylglutathione lyase family enzyme